MGRVSETDGWVILTTAGMRTLPLTRALAAAGVEAWTPMRTERRRGRGKKRSEVVTFEVAVLPSVVFARACHEADLRAALRLPVSPYPAFQFFRDHERRIPVIADASLSSLRAVEERFKRSALKSARQRVEPGSRVSISKGAFAGMTGIVTHGTSKEAFVDLGFGKPVSIASYLIGTDVVQIAPQPKMGIAA